MEGNISARHKLVVGYIPYTLVAILLVLLLLSLSHSWAAELAGGVIFVAWSFGLLLCQLTIFWLPGKSQDRARFHMNCILVTVASLLVAPFVVALLVWIGGEAIRLAA